MTRTLFATDARRLSSAVDRLDAVAATDREAAARHVFDVCVYHVTRVRKSHPGPLHHRGRGRLPSNHLQPTAVLVFDIVHPHIYRIARRLDRAMRHAEISPHPADAAALIVAVDAQGALAALFAVAQNAGVDAAELDRLAVPVRKRSAPALLRTLFSPDMRVANAAKKALRQVAAIASCQATPWMTSIRAALELRTAGKMFRSGLLRNLLGKLAEILHLVVRQAAGGRGKGRDALTRKRSSRSSLGAMIGKPRPSLNSERRKREEKMMIKGARRGREGILAWLGGAVFWKGSSRGTIEGERDRDRDRDRSYRRRNRNDGMSGGRIGGGSGQGIGRKSDSVDDGRHSASNEALSNAGSYYGSVFSTVTELGGGLRSLSGSGMRRGTGTGTGTGTVTTIKRDAATAMYIFERLLAKRTNPDLEDRIQVISTLADIAQVTFSGHYASSHKLDYAEEYSRTMADVFERHGRSIYSVVLDILFRPVREIDANRIGVFSFHETGLMDFSSDLPFTRRRLTQFPQNTVCLPNMDCTGLAAVSCNSLLKVLLRFVPAICAQRMALLTGTINSAFLHSSEALQRTEDGCSWDISKVVSAVDSLTVLVAIIPKTVDQALHLIVNEPVTLRLVIETCIRSVSATGRLLAQNAARPSAPRLTDEGTLDSLRSWQALIRIVPSTSSWTGTPSYSSSVLFLAQVARRAALISVLQGYRKERYMTHFDNDKVGDDAYPSVSLNAAGSPGAISMEDNDGSGPPSCGGNEAGFESEDENALIGELHQCIIAMINVAGCTPGDVFFELYRTVVYLYATELRKCGNRISGKAAVAGSSSEGRTCLSKRNVVGSRISALEHMARRVGAPGVSERTQSEEDAKGVLVENIAVDGQLPSRALRRAVMASELDLIEYFDTSSGQPLSLQHVSSHQSGVPPGMHTFEEFSYAIAIIMGALHNKTVAENLVEDPQEASDMIARDVHKSGSAYLKRVHKRARSILKRNSRNQNYDWRAVRYEERIRKLEEEVATLKGLLRSTFEEGMNFSKRRTLPKILSLSAEETGAKTVADPSDPLCCPSNCFGPT